jgi:molybdopterin-synthase adenylyltransferase
VVRPRSSLPDRLRTKPTLNPFRTSAGIILLSRDVYGLGRQIRDDERGTLWRLLGLLDGSRTVGEVIEILRGEIPGLEPAEVRRALGRLWRLGVLEDPGAASTSDLSAEELERYSRNLDFFSTATLGSSRPAHDLQARLKRARVTILGVGGVGGASALSLAAAGVGHIRLIDSDRVETSNLNRQILFGSRDVGRLKVDVAADRLRDLNPHVEVAVESRRADGPTDLPELVRGCDLFLLGADQPHEILLWANDAAYAAGVPWLENSYNGPRCAIALFVPGRTPCLRCLQHHLEEKLRAGGLAEGAELVGSSRANPVVAPTAGVAGHYGALQALYFLTGLPAAAEGRMVHLNLWRPSDVRVVTPPHWPDCPTCGHTPPSPAPGRRKRKPRASETGISMES